jgi:signal transduction histidine kinase
MAIVYGIVQQFGGWIRAESELGKGTRFLIRLPAAALAATQPL